MAEVSSTLIREIIIIILGILKDIPRGNTWNGF